MKISIIVCAYNGEVDMPSCLTSLVGQQGISSDEYEVLIIDDGSKDRTGEVSKKFVSEQAGKETSFRYIRITHGGLSVARNTGLFLAKSPIVAYIDQDAEADPHWVSQLLKAWDAHPEADVIGGRIDIRNKESRVARYFHHVYYDPGDAVGIIGANMSFRKERLLKAGAFGDPFISRGDDTFMVFKLGEGAEIIKWEKAIVRHDRPDSVLAWLKERVENGRIVMLRYEVSGVSRKIWAKFLIKRLAIIALLAGLLFKFWLFVAVLFLGLFYRVVKLRSWSAFAERISPRSFVQGVLWTLLAGAGEMAFFQGLIRGFFYPSLDKESAWQGTVSDTAIIEEQASC